MFTLPVITYYVCFYSVFQDKHQPENWAGGMAILVTNIIIGIYVWSAFSEPEEETRMAPKTGKVRTDWWDLLECVLWWESKKDVNDWDGYERRGTSLRM